jgi:hypothetical protein
MTEKEEEEIDDEDESYNILQMISVDPGWRAIFFDPQTKVPTTRPLVCFALVGDADDDTTIRPMVADDVGTVDDAAAFEDFIGLAAPGESADVIVKRIKPV